MASMEMTIDGIRVGAMNNQRVPILRDWERMVTFYGFSK